MNIFKIISYIGYGLTAFGFSGAGILYSLSPKIMPYHQVALEIPWNTLPEGSRWMLLNYQRSVAAGFITTGITILILFLIPFRSGELWARIAIFSVAIIELGNISWRTYSTLIHTKATPPLIGLLALLFIILCSFICSMIGFRAEV